MPCDPVLIVDGHLDMAFNALYHRRDLTQPVHLLREREDPVRSGVSAHPDSLERRQGPQGGRYTVTVTLPALRQGRVGIICSTIMARVQLTAQRTDNAVRTQVAAYAEGMAHLHYYQALEREGEIRFIRSIEDLDACEAAWQNPDEHTPVGLILTAEGADPILGPDQVPLWWEGGLRAVSLTHFGANTYGHGTGTQGGLYPPAYPLMDALREVGMVLDLSHASDLSFRQILEYWDGPVHVSHANCRALLRGQRHLSDEMIRAVADRDGVIGMVFAEQMLSPTWDFDRPEGNYATATRPMSAVVDHLDHVCQLLGNARHVAMGTDLDGGYGRELAPIDYDTSADLQRFPEILRRRGYGEEDVRGICHGNLLGLFRRAWRKA
ncbi:MAG: membrane dipeptidase [Candidatus Latescibacterota bacterium]|jgi:membrane dipeptidase